MSEKTPEETKEMKEESTPLETENNNNENKKTGGAVKETKEADIKEKSEEGASGIPEIAEPKHRNKVIVLFIVLGILLIMGLYEGFSLLHTHHQKAATEEEKFNVAGNGSAASNANTNTNSTTPVVPTQTLPADQTALLAAQELKEKQIEAAKKALEERLQAPLMIVNNAGHSTTASATTTSPASTDPNTHFLNSVSNETTDTVNATQITELNNTITEGTVIHAVLETAINSDLPGFVRAIVSEPVYSADGSNVLIVPGSRLMGVYKSQLQQAQTRLFVVWTEVIEPNGITVQLNSPGTDNLGRSGFDADKVDTHFWKKFGTAVLLSVLGAGASNVGVSSDDEANASQAYREAVAQSLTQSASDSMSQMLSIPPTIYINQGKPIMVFVIRRLNFSSVNQQAAKKLYVF